MKVRVVFEASGNGTDLLEDAKGYYEKVCVFPRLPVGGDGIFIGRDCIGYVDDLGYDVGPGCEWEMSIVAKPMIRFRADDLAGLIAAGFTKVQTLDAGNK